VPSVWRSAAIRGVVDGVGRRFARGLITAADDRDASIKIDVATSAALDVDAPPPGLLGVLGLLVLGRPEQRIELGHSRAERVRRRRVLVATA